MELRHLRYFVAVAGSLNVSKAAARLRVAQPALSRQIRDLETELGVPLLERHPRGVRLTAAGRTLVEEAQAILDQTQRAVDTVRASADGQHGKLDLGYAPSPTAELLPRALHAFQNRAPHVRVRLHDLSSEEMLRGVREQRLDLALMVRPGDAALRGLKFEELAQFPIHVAVGPAHRLAPARTAVELGDLAGERFHILAPAEYPEYRHWLARLLASAGQRLRVADEHDGATSLITAVEAGRGIALVPSCLECLAGIRLRFRPVHPAPKPLVVGVCWRAANPNRAAAALLEVLRELRGHQPSRPTPRLTARQRLPGRGASMKLKP